VSIVNATEECPRASETTFGWTPATRSVEAKACRRSWSLAVGTPATAAIREYAWLRVSGSRCFPSPRSTTRSRSLQAGPASSRRSACSFRCRRSCSTTDGGREIRASGAIRLRRDEANLSPDLLERPLDVELPGVEVDGRPLQPEDLAPSHPGRGAEQDGHLVRVRGRTDDRTSLVGSRNPERPPVGARGPHRGAGVHAEELPADRLGERRAQDPMSLEDGRGRRTLGQHPVDHRLDVDGPELREPHPAYPGRDLYPDERSVPAECRWSDPRVDVGEPGLLEVARERRRAVRRRRAGVDLAEQLRQFPLGVPS